MAFNFLKEEALKERNEAIILIPCIQILFFFLIHLMIPSSHVTNNALLSYFLSQNFYFFRFFKNDLTEGLLEYNLANFYSIEQYVLRKFFSHIILTLLPGFFLFVIIAFLNNFVSSSFMLCTFLSALYIHAILFTLDGCNLILQKNNFLIYMILFPLNIVGPLLCLIYIKDPQTDLILFLLAINLVIFSLSINFVIWCLRTYYR